MSDVGRVVAVGEKDECVIDAQLRAPLIEGHAEFVVEQPAEGTGTGSDPLPEFGQRGAVCGMLVQHPRDGLQPIIVWLRQLQWLLVRFAEFVDEDPAEASARSAVPVARGAVVVAWAREGEQDFAGEVGDHEHGRMAWREPGQGCRQEEDPHIGVAVSAVVVREPGGGPSDPIGGNDRCATFGVHGQDTASRVHQVPTWMGMH